VYGGRGLAASVLFSYSLTPSAVVSLAIAWRGGVDHRPVGSGGLVGIGLAYFSALIYAATFWSRAPHTQCGPGLAAAIITASAASIFGGSPWPRVALPLRPFGWAAVVAIPCFDSRRILSFSRWAQAIGATDPPTLSTLSGNDGSAGVLLLGESLAPVRSSVARLLSRRR